MEACRNKGIHTAIESSVYCEIETISRFIEVVDLFIVDLKIFSQMQHIHYTGKSNNIIKENIRYIVESDKDILVRVPMVENITDSDENLDSIRSFINGMNNRIPIEYLSFNPLVENNYKRLGIPFLLK